MGVECLRLLNEIIADFDEVPEPFFSFLGLCLSGNEREPLGELLLCVCYRLRASFCSSWTRSATRI